MMKVQTCKKDAVVRLISVSKTYNGSGQGQAVLKQVSFESGPGEMVLLLGPSGSGKTTLLTMLAGLQRPTTGEVYLFGKNITNFSQRELQKLRAEKMGFIFQTFKLIESVSVLENLLLVLRFAGITGNAAKSKAKAIIEEMGLQHHLYSLPRFISHGEKQRVAVARAIVNNAPLIIADEPTGSLNTDQGMKIARLLKQSTFNDKRCVIIASHDERIAQFADRIFFLNDGMLKEGK